MNKNNLGARMYHDGFFSAKRQYPETKRRGRALEGDALRRKLEGKRILEAVAC